ncbi:unnamed protein product [Cercopithifilaria johnstoni]|uniref:Uncharacterized protein n=1 Tax=Cercopithifilaria johnstoni TaxID=2874296 RepID=A0A8J2LN26_9BILA|nr:unnamed protein product [Cercopithifilaria johnstoni]
MRLSGCLLSLLQVFQLFIINAENGETVRIHGLLACGGASVFGARLKLYDGGEFQATDESNSKIRRAISAHMFFVDNSKLFTAGLKDDGTVANHWDEFLFEVKNIDTSKLYLTIDHHCDGGILHEQCIRKDKLLFQQVAKRQLIYHIGVLELQNATVLHPKILYHIESHDGCKCYNQNLFQGNSASCINYIKMNQEKILKNHKEIIDEN